MVHVAIMNKKWGFVDKILNGQKTVESRWYKNKYRPWDAVKKGEMVYFKNSGEKVVARATIKKVLQFSDLSENKVMEILHRYGRNIGIEEHDAPTFYKMWTRKKYCILLFLHKAHKVSPFTINKKGFGAMASWISVEDIREIML